MPDLIIIFIVLILCLFFGVGALGALIAVILTYIALNLIFN